MILLGIDFGDEIQKSPKGTYVWANGKNHHKYHYDCDDKKYPLYQQKSVRSLTLRKLVWLNYQLSEARLNPAKIQFSLLIQIIKEKLKCSRRTAYDYSVAIYYFYLYR
jgi:hypothetical protein